MKDLDRALVIDPRSGRAYRVRSLVYCELGDAARSTADLAKAKNSATPMTTWPTRQPTARHSGPHCPARTSWPLQSSAVEPRGRGDPQRHGPLRASHGVSFLWLNHGHDKGGATYASGEHVLTTAGSISLQWSPAANGAAATLGRGWRAASVVARARPSGRHRIVPVEPSGVHKAHHRGGTLARRRLPANNQLLRPNAIGRIWFSTQLLSAGRSPSSR